MEMLLGLQIQRDSPCEKVRCDWLDEWAKDLTACLLQTWQCNDGIGDTPWNHSDGFGFPGHPRKRTAGDGLVTSPRWPMIRSFIRRRTSPIDVWSVCEPILIRTPTRK